MRWLRALVISCVISALSGCESSVLVITFTDLPQGTASVLLTVGLQAAGDAMPVPQEDIMVSGDLTRPIGLRFPSANVLRLTVSASARRSDARVCGTGSLDVLFPAGARTDKTLHFSGGSC